MQKIILPADGFGKSHERNISIEYAKKNGMIKSTILIMELEFTDEAIAFARGYIKDIHCHLNLITDSDNNFVPLNDEFIRSKFCIDGQFKGYPKNLNISNLIRWHIKK